MNFKMMGRFLAQIIAIEGIFMLPALGISLGCGEWDAVRGFAITLAIMVVLGSALFLLCRKAGRLFGAREGFVCVSFSWITLSLLGALPFCISVAIPHYIDAVFETVSGFATTDFDTWPTFSKAILLALMVIGASAGSTGGGIKVARVLLIFKSLRRNIRKVLNPSKVQVIRTNGKTVDEQVVDNTNAYLSAYVIIIIVSVLLISLDGFSTGTNISAVLACFNNIGPGLELVGPTCNYSCYSMLSKLVLIIDMLCGRLEIFPMLVLLSRSTWRKH